MRLSQHVLTPSHQLGAHPRLAARHWLAIILIVLAAIFVVQNTVRHEVHLLWVTVEAATWLVLIVIFLVGVVTGVLLGRRRR
jgi:putative membrane protein